MINNIYALKDILTIYEDKGLLDNIILVGSWAEYFYEDYFDNYKSLMKTQDFDFFIHDDKSINKKINLVEEFDTIGFYPQIDYITSLKRTGESPIELKKLNINAESLPYFDITYAYNMKVDFNGISLTIPTPQAYVIQKNTN